MEEIRKLLLNAKLTDIDRRIAFECIAKRMCDVDAGVAVGYSRRTVGRHMAEVILPELHRIMNGAT